jgi:hypothetical protein
MHAHCVSAIATPLDFVIADCIRNSALLRLRVQQRVRDALPVDSHARIV